MNSSLLQLCRTGLVLITCLAAVTPAEACRRSRTSTYNHECYLQGVDESGGLTNEGGDSVNFCAVVNTRTGALIGTVKGEVENESGHRQCYRNVDQINNEAEITCSVYRVSRRGFACYTARGSVSDNQDA